MGSPLFYDLIHYCSVVGPNYYMRPLYHVTNASAHSTLLTVPADLCDIFLATDPTSPE